jgi:ribonuclease BN (tRNA processing enzyme)
MSRLEVVVVGVGDSFSEEHHSTALLLVWDGFHLAVDCPDMYRSALRSAAERSGRMLIEAAGRTLGYSSDTAFDPALIAFLEPADLIIHETNLGPAHTPYTALAALPAELRARMRLIHYPDGFDIAASTIAALREGEVLHPCGER